jgi:hypothetical protein
VCEFTLDTERSQFAVSFARSFATPWMSYEGVSRARHTIASEKWNGQSEDIDSINFKSLDISGSDRPSPQFTQWRVRCWDGLQAGGGSPTVSSLGGGDTRRRRGSTRSAHTPNAKTHARAHAIIILISSSGRARRRRQVLVKLNRKLIQTRLLRDARGGGPSRARALASRGSARGGAQDRI